MKSKEKIGIIALMNNSFIQRDIALLAEKYNTKVRILKNTKGWRYGFSLLLLAVQLMIWRLSGVMKIYSFFADYHSWIATSLSQLTNQKVFVRLGGYELNSVPEIMYGAQLNPFRKKVISSVIRNADYLLPVALDLEKKAILLRGNSEGVVHIPNAFDTEKFSYERPRTSESILTVAAIHSKREFLLKGVDLIIECAKRNSDVSFTIAGVNPSFRDTVEWPENFLVLGKCSQEELIKLYHNHRYLLIPSRSEGMPNVLCEAILCGCIPMGTNVGDIKEVIGHHELILNDYTPTEFERVYNFAKHLSEEDVYSLMMKVSERYNLSIRRERLFSLLQQC